MSLSHRISSQDTSTTSPIQTANSFHSIRTVTSIDRGNGFEGDSDNSSAQSSSLGGSPNRYKREDERMQFNSADYFLESEHEADATTQSGKPFTIDEILATSSSYERSYDYPYPDQVDEV